MVSITSITWNKSYFYSSKQYILTIDAEDDGGLDLTYQVTSDDVNVTITQDTNYSNKFNITFPSYSSDTTVTFTITVTNTNSESATDNSQVTVFPYHLPIINDIHWDQSIHNDNQVYVAKIDSDFGKSIVEADLTSNDPNITIDKTEDIGSFKVTYPTYTSPQKVTFTLTFTNESGDVTTKTFSTYVYSDSASNYQTAVVISSVSSWRDPILGESSDIEKIKLDVPSNGVTHGTLDSTCQEYASMGATSNGYNGRGVLFGGEVGYTTLKNNIQYFNIVTGEQTNIFGVLTRDCSGNGASSNGPNDRGVYGGFGSIDYITISSPGDATSFCTLPAVQNLNEGIGFSNDIDDRGIHIGNFGTTTNDWVIYFITFSNPGNCTVFGDLSVQLSELMSGTSNGVDQRGLIFASGGAVNGTTNKDIHYITINTPGNSVFFGKTLKSSTHTSSTSNKTGQRAVLHDGNVDSSLTNSIESINISVVGSNGAHFGNLLKTLEFAAMTSNS